MYLLYMDISPTWGSLLFSLWIPRYVDKPIGLLPFILLQYINFGSPEPVSRPLALSVPVALTITDSWLKCRVLERQFCLCIQLLRRSYSVS